MKLHHIIVASWLCLLSHTTVWAQSLSAQTAVQPTWQSIHQRGYPQWFSDAKLGIFVHWGLYSVPAYASPEGYAEWLYRGLMVADSGRVEIMKQYPSAYTGTMPQPLDLYAGLRNYWHAEMWNPDQWATLFKDAGAQYVLLVTKHHDGYCLWDYPNTLLPQWNSVESGPRRNIVEELTTAVRKQGLRMGFYYSLAEWSNPLHRWTVSPNDSIGNYVANYMIPQFKDLVSRYHPSVLFTDGEWDNTAEQWHARELISWYYNTVGPEAIVNDRWGSGHRHGYKTPEYSGGIMDTVTPWAECRGVGRSFGLNRNEPLSNYLTSDELIQHFVKLVAAGGGLTLNVGPSADGLIPLLQQERLLDLGQWLSVNGEAIYGSRAWKAPYENLDPIEYMRTDSTIDFNWVRNAPIKGMTYDHFSIAWHGTIIPQHSEKYTFTVQADDNAIVTLNGDTIIHYLKTNATSTSSNAQDAKAAAANTATVKLKKGERYALHVAYQEVDLEARIHLQWSSKSQPKEAIAAKEGFVGHYKCYQPSICYTRKGGNLYAIVFHRPADSVVLQHVPTPNSQVQVSLLGSDTPLPYSSQSGKFVIDTHALPHSDIDRSRAAWVFRIANILP